MKSSYHYNVTCIFALNSGSVIPDLIRDPVLFLDSGLRRNDGSVMVSFVVVLFKRSKIGDLEFTAVGWIVKCAKGPMCQDRFLYKSRYFTDAGIIGSKEFVKSIMLFEHSNNHALECS